MTTKVTSEFLHSAIISDHTQVTAADADHLLIHDASDNTLKKALVSTISSSSAADDITAGDAAVTISTTSGNITIDNASSDDDIIFKGTDGGSDITALTLDMSAGGDAIFGGKIQANDAIKFNSNTGTPEFQFFGSGTETGVINLGSSNFIIESKVSDKDIIFKGVDGGSDITALTLDMSEAGAATFNNKVGINNSSGSEYIRLNPNGDSYFLGGKVGIGTATPDTDGYPYAEDLVLNGGASASDGVGLSLQSQSRRYGVIAFGDTSQTNAGEIWYDHNTNSLNIRTAGTQRFSLDSSGNAIFTGNVTAYGSVSDERLKENIKVIENPIEKIKDLKGVTFTYKKDGEKSTGLIAQDLEKVLPEAVYTSETIADEREDEESEEHLAIRYGNTVGLLVEAIKELEARVKELEGK
jgi:hypothetical protein